jgi:cytoskeletal protein CcmA (bactofilin family)
LEKRFRKYQNNLSEGKFIGELFALISQVEINFTNNLLNKIKTSKITTVKGVLDLELV